MKHLQLQLKSSMLYSKKLHLNHCSPCAAETNVDNLEQDNSCLQDSLLLVEQLLIIVPHSIQTEWASKFVPTLAQVDIQKHPEHFKTFQEHVIINTHPLPNDTQAVVS